MIAGPNGSGKTTITDKIRSRGHDFGEYINPDEITQDLLKHTTSPSPQDIFKANHQAQIIAEQRRQTALDEGRSLSLETVMSHPSKVDFMRLAKDRGYKIDFFFVATDDPLINLDRVKNRVQEGGHDVPSDKVISRYERVMNLLPEAISVSDRTIIYDNSQEEQPLRLTAVIEQGKNVTHLDNPPHWVNDRILKPIQKDHLIQEGSFKDKAQNFHALLSKDLLEKYTNDQTILNALAVRETARLFADQHLQDVKDQERFLEMVEARVSYNLEHGRSNHSPRVLEQQTHRASTKEVER